MYSPELFATKLISNLYYKVHVYKHCFASISGAEAHKPLFSLTHRCPPAPFLSRLSSGPRPKRSSVGMKSGGLGAGTDGGGTVWKSRKGTGLEKQC